MTDSEYTRIKKMKNLIETCFLICDMLKTYLHMIQEKEEGK